MKFFRLSILTAACSALSVSAIGQGLVSDLDVQRSVRLGSKSTGTISPTLSANVDDWAPAGFASAFAIRVSTDASRNVTGITAGASGMVKTLDNVGSFPLVLKNQDAASSAANRFALAADFTIQPGSGVVLRYDDSSSRWRILGNQTGSPAGLQTIWIPALAFAPLTTGGPTAEQTELTPGGPEISAMSFDPDTAQAAQFSVAMPKSWNNGTVTAVFYWTHGVTDTNFGVVWNLAGVAMGNAETIDASYGTAQQVADTGGTTSALYISASTPALTVAGSPASGDLVFFRVSRVVGDGADTMAAPALLLGVKLLYTSATANDE